MSSKVKGIVILTDGTVQPFNGTSEDIHNAVGGWIEAVPSIHRKVNATVYCCEEGKLRGYPPNIAASKLWFFLGGSGNVMHGDILVGNVVVVGGVDAEGDDTDLDPGLEDKLRWVLDLVTP